MFRSRRARKESGREAGMGASQAARTNRNNDKHTIYTNEHTHMCYSRCVYIIMIVICIILVIVIIVSFIMLLLLLLLLLLLIIIIIMLIMTILNTNTTNTANNSSSPEGAVMHAAETWTEVDPVLGVESEFYSLVCLCVFLLTQTYYVMIYRTSAIIIL